MTQTDPLPPTDISMTATNHESLAVMAYRMGAVERNVQTLVDRFDSVAQYYVTSATLMLTLDPLKERVIELENNEKARDKQRNTEQAQFRLAIVIAVLSPIFSIIVNLVVNSK